MVECINENTLSLIVNLLVLLNETAHRCFP